MGGGITVSDFDTSYPPSLWSEPESPPEGFAAMSQPTNETEDDEMPTPEPDPVPDDVPDEPDTDE